MEASPLNNISSSAPSTSTQGTANLGQGIKSFTLGGLASGLDTNSIIQQLVAIDSQPITQMQTREAAMTSKLALYQDLNSKVAALKTASDKLSAPTMWQGMTATSSDTGVLTATANANNTAQAGAHSVIVKQVGSASTLGSDGSVSALSTTRTLDQAGYATALQFVTRTATDAGGTSKTGDGGAFTINGTTVNYWKTDTLQDVVNRINSTVSGVTASYDPKADKMTFSSSGGGQITVTDTVGNFVQANGFLNNQVGTGSVSSTGHIAKPVTASTAVTALATPVTTGVMSINGAAIGVNATDTLQSVMDKINRSAAGVTASFSSTTNSLVLTSNNLGSTQITLGKDSSGFVKAMHLDTATTKLGQSTVVNVDGIDFSRNSTKLTDVIQGVTLNVTKPSPTDLSGMRQPVSVSVAQDTDTMQKNLQGFVDAYNTLVDFYNTNTTAPQFDSTNTVTVPAGALLGDGALNDVMFYLKTTFTEQVPGLPSNMNNLSDIGITLGDPKAKPPPGSASGTVGDGSKLAFDPSVFIQAMFNNPDGVSKMFTKASDGFASMLGKTFKSLIGSPGAIMDSTLTLQNQQISDTDHHVQDLQARVRAKQQDYLKMFTDMERTMSNIQTQGNSVISMLNAQMNVGTNSSSG